MPGGRAPSRQRGVLERFRPQADGGDVPQSSWAPARGLRTPAQRTGPSATRANGCCASANGTALQTTTATADGQTLTTVTLDLPGVDVLKLYYK